MHQLVSSLGEELDRGGVELTITLGHGLRGNCSTELKVYIWVSSIPIFNFLA